LAAWPPGALSADGKSKSNGGQLCRFVEKSRGSGRNCPAPRREKEEDMVGIDDVFLLVPLVSFFFFFFLLSIPATTELVPFYRNSITRINKSLSLSLSLFICC